MDADLDQRIAHFWTVVWPVLQPKLEAVIQAELSPGSDVRPLTPETVALLHETGIAVREINEQLRVQFGSGQPASVYELVIHTGDFESRMTAQRMVGVAPKTPDWTFLSGIPAQWVDDKLPFEHITFDGTLFYNDGFRFIVEPDDDEPTKPGITLTHTAFGSHPSDTKGCSGASFTILEAALGEDVVWDNVGFIEMLSPHDFDEALREAEVDGASFTVLDLKGLRDAVWGYLRKHAS